MTTVFNDDARNVFWEGYEKALDLINSPAKDPVFFDDMSKAFDAFFNESDLDVNERLKKLSSHVWLKHVEFHPEEEQKIAAIETYLRKKWEKTEKDRNEGIKEPKDRLKLLMEKIKAYKFLSLEEKKEKKARQEALRKPALTAAEVIQTREFTLKPVNLWEGLAVKTEEKVTNTPSVSENEDRKIIVQNIQKEAVHLDDGVQKQIEAQNKQPQMNEILQAEAKNENQAKVHQEELKVVAKISEPSEKITSADPSVQKVEILAVEKQSIKIEELPNSVTSSAKIEEPKSPSHEQEKKQSRLIDFLRVIFSPFTALGRWLKKCFRRG